MDNYVVRIYRHKKDNPNRLVGVVEKIGDEGKKAFTNLDELWQILNPSKKVSYRQLESSGKNKNRRC
ncbi:MAG: hypothetical protein HZA14_07545 [Nitrospirae bacterium]|nr:hypothetical protein [Nitrospirota bacterium]